MNKKTLNIVSIVVGGIAALVAVFFFVKTIIALTDYASGSWDGVVKYNIYVTICAILFALLAVALGFAAFKLIKGFLDKKDAAVEAIAFPVIAYLAYEAIFNFNGMCFWGFDSGRAWATLILAAGGAVVALLALFMKGLAANVKSILLIVASGLAFVVAIMALTNVGGFDTAVYVFTMLLYVATTCYFIFDIVVSQQSGAKTE